MRCATPRNSAIFRWRLLLAMPALAFAVCGAASAESVYRWTGSDGTVHYSNVAPKGVSGVTRVEIDPDANTTAGRRTPHSGTDLPLPRIEQQESTDILVQRRATRAKLEASLSEAQAQLDLAKAALAEAGGPRDDELQVIQNAGGTGSFPARSNCHVSGGQRVCAGVVPNQQYYERLQQLQDAVKRAEEDLAAAQTAYRRGVD